MYPESTQSLLNESTRMCTESTPAFLNVHRIYTEYFECTPNLHRASQMNLHECFTTKRDLLE